jgi:hypothetical protein
MGQKVPGQQLEVKASRICFSVSAGSIEQIKQFEPMSQMVPLPEKEYIEPLTQYCRKYMFLFHEEESGGTDGHRLLECMFRRFGPNVSSKAVRYACVLYSGAHLNFRFNGTPDVTQDLVYLDQIYKHARETISPDAYAELAYACYAVFKYGFSRIILIASCIAVSSPVYTLCCF